MTAGVFFDLGGTLFTYRNVPRATMPLLFEACERAGLPPDKAAIKAAYNQAGQETAARYADRHFYTHREFFLDTLGSFLRALGAASDPEIDAWYLEAHRVAIINCLEIKQDCITTLTHLRNAGLYLSVVSNIDDDMLEPLIAREQLDRHFDHWTSSEAAQSCKPHRGFFDYALGLSGLAPADVLFVGDSPEHDIEGAAAVGMRTALINDGGMPPPLQTGRDVTAPDHTIARLSDLTELYPAP